MIKIKSIWNQRKDNIDVVSKNIEMFLIKLGILNIELFNNFYLKAQSREKALKSSIKIDHKIIKEILQKRKKRGEIDEMGYCKNGFDFSLYLEDSNGKNGQISMNIGAFSPYLTNSILIKITDSSIIKSGEVDFISKTLKEIFDTKEVIIESSPRYR